MRDNLSSFILRAGRRLATAGGCAGNIENFKEYVHKVVGICGVPAGPFGGARVIEQLLPVVRELGLVTIFEDVNFGKVGTLFDERGNLLDESYVRRVDKFLNELIWMARVLRHGRENIAPV